MAAADGDSPLQSFPKISQNGRHQIPDFAFSPNPHNGGSSSDKHSVEGKPPPRREVPAKPAQAVSVSAPALNNQKEKEITIDAERFASARRRLHENYQEAQNGFSIFDSVLPKLNFALFPSPLATVSELLQILRVIYIN